MKRVDYLMAAMLALAVSAVACDQLKPSEDCVTDSECAALCPEGTRDLPADHPDYCDGGPTVEQVYSPTLGRMVQIESSRVQ